MNTTTWTPAMHAVLDGEATAQETASLDALLAADPEARAGFDRLNALFDRLAALEPKFPPEGLVASISAAVGEYSRSDQPFVRRGVLGSTAREIGLDEMTDQHAAASQPSSLSFFWEKSMNQQSGSNRKFWVGGGIAAIAAAVAIAFGTGTIPRSQDVNGTIVAAERYRAPQATTQDVQLGDTAIAQLLQNDAFLKVIKDREVQSLVVEPGFVPASQLILKDPDAVRQMLAGKVQAEAADMRLLQRHPLAAQMLLSNAEANRAMLQYPDASLRFVSNSIRDEADRNTAKNSQADRSVDAAAERNLTNRGVDASAERNLTNRGVDASAERNLTNRGVDASAERNLTNRGVDASAERNLTNRGVDASAERNLTNRGVDAAAERNLTNRGVDASAERNLTNRGQAEAAQRNNTSRGTQQ